MSGEVLQWLALALLGVAMIAAFGAMSARSLFVAVMHLAAAGVAVASVVLLLGSGEGALAVALLAAAWAPVLLLGAMLLSARAAKPPRALPTMLGWLGATIALPLLWWPLVELSAHAPTASLATTGSSSWIAPLVFVLAVVCLALLGYGERGALTRGDAS
ncbi:MAG: hypothetical protein AB7T59_10820 [Hyphomonadaceae bacterium]